MDVWLVYYRGVQVGRIGLRTGVPNDVDQWGWICGFDSQRFRIAQAPPLRSPWRSPNLRKRGSLPARLHRYRFRRTSRSTRLDDPEVRNA